MGVCGGGCGCRACLEGGVLGEGLGGFEATLRVLGVLDATFGGLRGRRSLLVLLADALREVGVGVAAVAVALHAGLEELAREDDLAVGAVDGHLAEVVEALGNAPVVVVDVAREVDLPFAALGVEELEVVSARHHAEVGTREGGRDRVLDLAWAGRARGVDEHVRPSDRLGTVLGGGSFVRTHVVELELGLGVGLQNEDVDGEAVGDDVREGGRDVDHVGLGLGVVCGAHPRRIHLLGVVQGDGGGDVSLKVDLDGVRLHQLVGGGYDLEVEDEPAAIGHEVFVHVDLLDVVRAGGEVGWERHVCILMYLQC